MSSKIIVQFHGVILLSLLFLGAAKSTEVSGYVYLDENKNLQRDAGEPGIAGVLVSNQLLVVETDSRGHYSIPLETGETLFITKPAGYTLPLSSRNLPQFYYHHSPKGSPSFEFNGISPTGDLPREINFPLYPGSPENNFEIIVFGDPQPRDLQEISYIRDDVVTELLGSTASGVIVLGDIMYNDLSHYDAYTEVISKMGIPSYHVPGNHDMNFDAPSDSNSLQTYRRWFGPTYYGFELGKVHFIVLDDVEYQGRNEEGQTVYIGNLGEKQLGWLNNYISKIPKDRLLVFNMHIPFYSFAGEHSSIRVEDRAEFFKILENRRHLLALAGHMHTIEHQFLGPEQGWLGKASFQQITCGAISGSWWSGPPDTRGIPVADQRDGAPNGYFIFSFEGHNFKERYKPAGFSPDYQLRISQPAGSFTRDSLKDTLIIVNVFDGNEKSVVEYQIDEGPVQQMTREVRRDPFFEQLHQKNQEYYRDWIRPVKSNHIWTAPLPADLTAGIHKITVSTVNPYGEIYRTYRLFEVVE